MTPRIESGNINKGEGVVICTELKRLAEVPDRIRELDGRELNVPDDHPEHDLRDLEQTRRIWMWDFLPAYDDGGNYTGLVHYRNEDRHFADMELEKELEDSRYDFEGGDVEEEDQSGLSQFIGGVDGSG